MADEPRRLYERLSHWLRVSLAAARKFLARCHAWCTACNPAVLAVLLLLPVFVLRHFDLLRLERFGNSAYGYLFWIAIFVVGGVQRSSWRHATTMALLAGTGCAVGNLIQWSPGGPDWFIILPVFYCTGFILFVAIGESSLISRRLPHSLGWLVALAVGAAAIHTLLYNFVRYCGWTVHVSTNGHGGAIPYRLQELYWPFLAAATWIAVRASYSYRGPISWRRSAWTLCGVALSVAALAVYGWFLLFEVARSSLACGYPFSRSNAALLLELRGRAADFELLWDVLEKDAWRPPSEFDPFVNDGDWRTDCIFILARHNRQDAAERLSRLLRERPRHALATAARDLLLGCRRFEAVPLLMRYALVDSVQRLDTSWRERFQPLGIPQTARLIFIEAIRDTALKKWRTSTDFGDPAGKWDWVEPKSFPVAPHLRSMLVEILGEDAGDDLPDWMVLYDDKIATLESPLTAAQQRDVERTCTCFEIYMRANGAWRDTRKARERQYAQQQLRTNFPDEFAELERVARADLLERQRVLYDPNSRAMSAGLKLEQYLDEARQKLAIREPDWDVPSTDDLVQEVKAYLERVQAEIPLEPAEPEFDEADQI